MGMGDIFKPQSTGSSAAQILNQPNGYHADWSKVFGPNGWLNWNDIFLPGSTAIDKWLDISGKQAAQNQYNAQLQLQKDAQAFNASQSALQREWEERMSSTAMQRQVSDLKAAGLNPYVLMSGSTPGGAATPSGSSASSSAGSADMANNKIAAAAGAFAVFLRFLLAKK